MHELYLWPFQDAVRAGAGAIMVRNHKKHILLVEMLTLTFDTVHLP